MKAFQTRIGHLLILLSIVSLPVVAHASSLIGSPGSGSSLKNADRPTQLTPTGLADMLNLIWGRLYKYIGLLAFIAVIALIWYGIRYATSQGDAKKTAETKQAIVQLVLALALITISTVVVSFIWSAAVLFSGA